MKNMRKRVNAGRNNWKAKLLTAVCATSMLLGITACGREGAEKAEELTSTHSVAGTVLLSVNPEIEVAYDDRGKVLELEGRNDDGIAILQEYENYKGKECAEVVSELVGKIYDGGYFVTQVEGHERNIVLKLEENSKYPEEDFLNSIAEGVRQAVDKHQAVSATVVVAAEDLDAQGRIGVEAAKNIVLAQLGFTEAEFTESNYDLEDGVYELEFTVAGVEYEYEVNAFSGKVVRADYEMNDDWADQDLDDEDPGDMDDDSEDAEAVDEADDMDDDAEDADDEEEADDMDEDTEDAEAVDEADDMDEDTEDAEAVEEADDEGDDMDEIGDVGSQSSSN